jgi:hypothetical protein
VFFTFKGILVQDFGLPSSLIFMWSFARLLFVTYFIYCSWRFDRMRKNWNRPYRIRSWFPPSWERDCQSEHLLCPNWYLSDCSRKTSHWHVILGFHHSERDCESKHLCPISLCPVKNMQLACCESTNHWHTWTVRTLTKLPIM